MSPQLGALLALVPPWALTSLLVGMICGAAFFIFAGRRVLSLPFYLALGGMAAVLGQTASLALDLEPWPVVFGQLHVAGAAVGALLLLCAARLYRL